MMPPKKLKPLFKRQETERSVTDTSEDDLDYRPNINVNVEALDATLGPMKPRSRTKQRIDSDSAGSSGEGSSEIISVQAGGESFLGQKRHSVQQ